MDRIEVYESDFGVVPIIYKKGRWKKVICVEKLINEEFNRIYKKDGDIRKYKVLMPFKEDI
jgi:hypothetical protein